MFNWFLTQQTFKCKKTSILISYFRSDINLEGVLFKKPLSISSHNKSVLTKKPFMFYNTSTAIAYSKSSFIKILTPEILFKLYYNKKKFPTKLLFRGFLGGIPQQTPFNRLLSFYNTSPRFIKLRSRLVKSFFRGRKIGLTKVSAFFTTSNNSSVRAILPLASKQVLRKAVFITKYLLLKKKNFVYKSLSCLEKKKLFYIL